MCRSDKEHQSSRVIYIRLSKSLKDYYTLRGYYIENSKCMVAGSDAARHIDLFVFNLPPTQPL
jgi:hypothetical protein